MRHRRAPGRPAGHEVDERLKLWFDALRRKQAAFERAEKARDETARQAIKDGLSVHSVGKALKMDPATAWRRYSERRAA